MNTNSRARWAGIASICLALVACGGGGGGSDAPPPPPAATTVIGAAGGTVFGPNGAKIVVPPGALTTETTLQIEESSAGAPALPAGFSARGQMLAFLPHGTTFAVPVTLTMPFDAATIPVGMAPAFYKTNAQNQWERVANTTFVDGTLGAKITSFSNGQNGVELAQCPLRQWFIHRTTKAPLWGFIMSPSVIDEQRCGEVKVPFLFGAADSTFEQDNGLTPNLAVGEVYSSPDGVSFSAYSEPPLGDPSNPETASGGAASLRQWQRYVKRAPDAKLRIILSAGFLAAADFNGRPQSIECNNQQIEKLPDEEIIKFCIPILSEIKFHVVAMRGPDAPGQLIEIFSTHGEAGIIGFDGKWKLYADPIGDASTPLWTEANFTRTGLDGSTPLVVLNTPLVLNVDLSSVEVCPPELAAIFCQAEAFIKLFSFVSAETWNWRGRESGAAAFIRDPQEIGGNALEITGLEATNNALPLLPEPAAPIACAAGPDPAAGVLQFNGTSFSVVEGSGTRGIRDILVTRTQGSKGAVSVNLSAGGGIAVSGVDYDIPPVTVRFGDGDTTPRLVAVNILSNKLIEPNKTLNLTLSNPGGCATLGSQTIAVLTILDDDQPPPTTSFSLGGTVTGLAGSGLVLTNLGVEQPIAANGTFAFALTVGNGLPYNVTVKTQPSNPTQLCGITNGSGTVAGANVTNVVVDCTTPSSVPGLDATFGVAGKVATASTGIGNAVAVQTDGRIVTVGSTFTLTRHDAFGSPDNSFGSGGKVTTSFGSGSGTANDVAIQSDGRIVVVGSTRARGGFSGDDNFTLRRYDSVGNLDQSFGSGGIVVTDFAGLADVAKAVVIQTDGKIVVAGRSQNASGTDFALARYDARGNLDGSFGNGGKLTTDVSGGPEGLPSIGLQSDGKIIVAGPFGIGNTIGGTAILRYSNTGVLDQSFGDRGKVIVASVLTADAMAVQPDDKIVVAGSVNGGNTNSAFGVTRFLSDGRPDIAFGTPTVAFFAPNTGNGSIGHGVAVQADGKIVVVGEAASGGGAAASDMALARFDANGLLDTGFGTGGKLLVDFFGAFDDVQDVAIQADGRIVAAGSARNGSALQFALIRVNP